MNRYYVSIHFDSGLDREYFTEANSEEEAYDEVYTDLGYDPGEIYVELAND